jgi:hypothetical protein
MSLEKVTRSYTSTAEMHFDLPNIYFLGSGVSVAASLRSQGVGRLFSRIGS